MNYINSIQKISNGITKTTEYLFSYEREKQ